MVALSMLDAQAGGAADVRVGFEHAPVWRVEGALMSTSRHAVLCCAVLQREAQIQYNISNNQTTGIMDTVRAAAAPAARRSCRGSSQGAGGRSTLTQCSKAQLPCQQPGVGAAAHFPRPRLLSRKTAADMRTHHSSQQSTLSVMESLQRVPAVLPPCRRHDYPHHHHHHLLSFPLLTHPSSLPPCLPPSSLPPLLPLLHRHPV